MALRPGSLSLPVWQPGGRRPSIRTTHPDRPYPTIAPTSPRPFAVLRCQPPKASSRAFTVPAMLAIPWAVETNGSWGLSTVIFVEAGDDSRFAGSRVLAFGVSSLLSRKFDAEPRDPTRLPTPRSRMVAFRVGVYRLAATRTATGVSS